MSKFQQKKEPAAPASAVSVPNKISKTIVGLLHVVCPLLFFTNLTRNPYYTQIALLNIGIALCAALYAVQCWQAKEWRFPRFSFETPLLVFLVCAFFSTAFSWIAHPNLRPGIFNEGVRVWVFTLVNCVVVIYLPALFTTPMSEKSRPLSIWSDLVLAFIWGALWLGFHEMRSPSGSLLWDPYGAFLWVLGGLYAYFRTRRSEMAEIMHVVFAVSVLASVYGIFQYWGRDMIWGSPVQPYGGRPVSTFGNPNFLSSYLMMVSPLAFAFGIVAAGRERAGYMLVAAVSVIGVLCTLTRSSYMGLLAGYSTLALLSFKRENLPTLKKAGLSIAIFLLLIVIFPHTPLSKVQSPLARFTEIYAAYKSGVSYGPWDQRILIWSCAWEMVRSNVILGAGWGCFELFYPFYQGQFILVERLAQWRTHANNAHNVLLEMWSQTGFLGTGAALWLMVVLIAGGWMLYRRQKDNPRGFILVGMVAALVGMLVDNFFGNVSIFFAVPAFLFWWIAGSLFFEAPVTRFSVRPIGGIQHLALIALTVFGLGTSVYFYKRWKQELFYFQGFKEAKGNAILPSIKSLETAVAWFSGEVNTDYEMGNSYSRYARELSDKGLSEEAKKFFDKSIVAYQQAIDANPGYDEIYFNLGVVLNQLGRPEEAEKNYLLCLLINPLFHDAYGSLGNFYINRGQMEKAVKILEAAVLSYPKDKDLWNNLGYCYSQLKQDDKSFEAYKKAIYIDPGFQQAWHNLGVAAAATKRRDPLLEVPGLIKEMEGYLSQRNYKAALRPAQQIAQALPDSPDSHLSLGNIYFYLGMTEQSESEYKKAIELNPRFTVAYTNLGRLLQVQGKTDAAQTYFQKTLEIDPNNQEAIKALSEIKR